jgi:hypothetical protein
VEGCAGCPVWARDAGAVQSWGQFVLIYVADAFRDILISQQFNIEAGDARFPLWLLFDVHTSYVPVSEIPFRPTAPSHQRIVSLQVNRWMLEELHK